ncbi:hypothetical protein Y032_0100g3320 [Ancylostoma ceylanicum]|uniref:Uncharacterized protein n=1 Tax=Ancylostoma ceylanicum TaxID=53326 RepID=A0A016TIP9_9BILA|nr:hypothetical protein Y032_0100g3320 [Ancylostoma ceylanicum]
MTITITSRPGIAPFTRGMKPTSSSTATLTRARRVSYPDSRIIKEFEVKVLQRNLVKLLDRKIMEAKEIKRYKPKINNREELVEALKYIA